MRLTNQCHERKPSRFLRTCRCAALSLAAAFGLAGCSSTGPHATQSHNQRQQVSTASYLQPEAVKHLALPATGFGTGVESPVIGIAPTTVNPAAMVPSPTPPTAVRQTLPTQAELVDAWDQFQNPRLRVLQELTLQNAISSGHELEQLQAAIRLGRGQGSAPTLDSESLQRELLLQVARAYIEVRFYQQLVQDFHANLQLQIESLATAQRRKAEGKAGRIDILQLQSRVGLTESAIIPVQAKLRDALKQLAVLKGSQITQPMIRAIADQPQLHLPQLDDRLPASILRQRCDVHSAEQQVVRMGNASGLAEAQLLPHLALQGELRAKSRVAGEKRGSFDFGIDLDESSDWSFSVTDSTLGHQSDHRSPIQRSMATFQSTVLAAARDVENLLTQYHQHLREVRMLEQTRTNANEALKLSLQQFEFGRVSGDHLVANHSQRLDADLALADARARLAQVGVDLFRATGGECHLEQVPAATFYQHRR